MSPTPPPKVSIAIPLYNAESHIRETIDSVLAQTFENFELIILDDQSTDASFSIATSYNDPRIIVQKNEKRLGFFGNWNACLDAMRAPYCKLLPHDDLLEPICLKSQVEVLDKYPEVALVHGARKIIDPQGNLLAVRRLREPTGSKEASSSLRKIIRSGTNPFGEPASVMFRKEAAKSIGGFSDTDMYSIDIDYWARLLAEGERYYINEILSSFRVWPDSASVQLFGTQAKAMHAFFKRLAKKHPDLIRPSDLWIGDLKAIFLELARGCFYFWVKHKKVHEG